VSLGLCVACAAQPVPHVDIPEIGLQPTMTPRGMSQIATHLKVSEYWVISESVSLWMGNLQSVIGEEYVSLDESLFEGVYTNPGPGIAWITNTNGDMASVPIGGLVFIRPSPTLDPIDEIVPVVQDTCSTQCDGSYWACCNKPATNGIKPCRCVQKSIIKTASCESGGEGSTECSISY